jgi:hypothetical protein
MYSIHALIDLQYKEPDKFNNTLFYLIENGLSNGFIFEKEHDPLFHELYTSLQQHTQATFFINASGEKIKVTITADTLTLEPASSNMQKKSADVAPYVLILIQLCENILIREIIANTGQA